MMPTSCGDCDERVNRLPGTAQARINQVVDATAGEYTVRMLGLVLAARANLPGKLSYSAGEDVAVTRLGVTSEYLIIGSMA